MTQTDGFALLAMGLIGGLYFFIKGFSWLKFKRMLENTPTSKIRSLAMGLVEVYGEVVPSVGMALKAPLTESGCVYYKYRVEEHRGSGKNSRWVTLMADEKLSPFFLRDETGTVLVDLKGANVDIPSDFSASSSVGSDPPANVMKFLNANNIRHDSFWMNKQMRFTEWHIAPGDKLYVLGTAGDNPFIDEASSKQNEADIMIQKSKGQTYYVSDKPEKAILSGLSWKFTLAIVGGGLLSLVCFAMLLMSFYNVEYYYGGSETVFMLVPVAFLIAPVIYYSLNIKNKKGAE